MCSSDLIMNRVDSIYDSPAAKEMHDAHANMQRSFQSFKEAIDDCRKYLIDVVKKGYEDIENAAASKISGVSNCGISKTISGVQKTSGGSIFSIALLISSSLYFLH